MNKTFQKYRDNVKEIGYVRQVIRNQVKVEGLPKARLSEMVLFEEGQRGYIYGLQEDYVEIAMLDYPAPTANSQVVRTNIPLALEIDKAPDGRLVDMFIDLDLERALQKPSLVIPIDKNPKSVGERVEVDEPLITNVACIDLLQPLGKGQRELIIGDRASGKTTTTLQILKSQAAQGLKAIYCIIGKRTQEITQLYEELQQFPDKENITIMAAAAHEPIGKIIMTPMSAMTLAEYYAEQGNNSIVVFDDMTIQAKFYREMALISGAFPGKESYPGDIFHLHAKLLERAGKFRHTHGTVSITALPICESYGSNLAGFIQTNLMSITDGHIFFDVDYFFKGIRPALNPFYSVTRVGRQTQTPLRQQLSQAALQLLHDYERALEFSKFGADVAEKTKSDLARGQRFWNVLLQKAEEFVPYSVELLYIGAILYSELTADQIKAFVTQYHKNKTFAKAVDNLEQIKTMQEFEQAVGKLLNTKNE